MNAREHYLYQSLSPFTIIRSGHLRIAMERGSALSIPSFFAGMDLAVTMLRLSSGSPDTTEGSRRMS